MILPTGGGLIVHCLPLGDLMTNCWVLAVEALKESAGATPMPRVEQSLGGEFAVEPPSAVPAADASVQGTCWVVDPDDDAPVIDLLRKKNCWLERIVVTHGHGDHIRGIAGLKRECPRALITAPAGDAHMLTDPVANLSMLLGMKITAPPADETVAPGDELSLGDLTWKVLDLSGHTPGGAGFYCRQAGVVVVGDALFADSIGRTDFPGCSGPRLIANIRAHLLSLPDSTRVLPGHGSPTTIGQERLNNPFLQED